jgi:hypothetical protein
MSILSICEDGGNFIEMEAHKQLSEKAGQKTEKVI